MAIQHHPLSNALFGEFVGYRHEGKNTVFDYEYASVTLTCPDNTAFKWITKFNDETMFPNALHYDIAPVEVNPGLDQHSIDGMDDMAFNSRSEADETSTLQGIEYSTTADIDSIKKD